MKTLKNKIMLDIAFLLALIFKVTSYGSSYFPVLDDYIQYGGYPLYESLSHVYLKIGTIATRPFASILDPAVWGTFYPNMLIPLLIITVLFFFAAKLIASTLEKLKIFITPFLYAILLICPLGFEGTYWLSASSRICVGLFFTGLALSFLIKLIEKKKKIWLVPYVLSTLLSFGFYESVMIVSALLQFFVIVTLLKSNKKRLLHLITPLLCGVLMLLYYKLFGNIGALGSRANGFSFENLGQNTIALFSQFFEILIKGGILTTAKGALSGTKLMCESLSGLIRLLIIVLISLLCAYLSKNEEFKAPKKCILFGIALTFLPLAPNVLTTDVWLTYRSVVPCFIGLVLLSAPLFVKIFKKTTVRFTVIFAIILIFMCANVNELDTYRRVHEADSALVTEICEQLDDDVLSGEKETIVVLKEEIITPQVSYYKDHVKSVFSSDWALTGAIRAKCRNVKIKMVTPVYSKDEILTDGKQIIYIGGNYE